MKNKGILGLIVVILTLTNAVAEIKTKGKVLMVVANPSTSTVTGWPVGFWGAELSHPYLELSEAGFSVDIASPSGGKVELDAYSDPRDKSGYSKNDLITLGFLNSPDHAKLIDNTKKISDLNPAKYRAIVIAGGQSPMFTFRNNPDLQKLFLAFYNNKKPSAALCHGTALLLDLKDKKGNALIKGKKMTGFSNAEEDYVDQASGQKVMPFRIEDEAKKLGARFVSQPAFTPFAIQDGNLITGQQQNSGKEVARILIKLLR